MRRTHIFRPDLPQLPENNRLQLSRRGTVRPRKQDVIVHDVVNPRFDPRGTGGVDKLAQDITLEWALAPGVIVTSSPWEADVGRPEIESAACSNHTIPNDAISDDDDETSDRSQG